jgi:hypothetical protein
MLGAFRVSVGETLVRVFSAPIIGPLSKEVWRFIAMDYEVHKVDGAEEFKVCPECDYKDGFHSMFKKEGEVTKWLFICPSCHYVFDIGFAAP